jgi:hypothetical protein
MKKLNIEEKSLLGSNAPSTVRSQKFQRYILPNTRFDHCDRLISLKLKGVCVCVVGDILLAYR